MVASKFYNLDVDNTLGGNSASDYIIASQKATKGYIDNRIDGTAHTATNPALTPVEGVCTWTVTHNLGTEDVICSMYSGSVEIQKNVTIVSANQITLSFLSTSTVTAGSCTAVVLASGGAQGSGGGSTITVDSALSTTSENPVQNKVITTALNNKLDSSAYIIDSALNSTSENPVQNKVLYPSLNGFLPDGTIITVETDGSGDFTSVVDAIDSLAGKWSNGDVTIQIGNGTFATSDFTVDTLTFNIPHLVINGSGVSNTILSNSSQTGNGIFIKYSNSIILLKNFTYKRPATALTTSGVGIRPSVGSNVILSNIAVEGCGVGIGSECCLLCTVNDNISIKWANLGIDAHQAGFIKIQSDANITFNTCTTAFNVRGGGKLQATTPTVTYTNVTNKTNQTVGNATNNGWITGITV